MKTLKQTGFSVSAWLCCISISFAQQDADSVRQLQEVVVQHTRLEPYAIAHYVLRVDSGVSQLASYGTVADMLRKNGFGHIRSYGVGGVTTPSFRGTGASHTAILWNGINLQSPLLGQTDFTHVPISFIDDVQLQSGGSASLYGSGSIGGTVHLNNKAQFGQGFRVAFSSSVGSFASYFNGGTIAWSGKRFISSTKIFSIQSANDFKYTNKNINPPKSETRTNAGIAQWGVLQQNYWRLNANQIFHLRFWYQNNDIEVPNPTTVSRPGQATQQDEFYRTQVGWEFDRDNVRLTYQSSFIRHSLNYQDPLVQITSRSVFDSFVNNFDFEKNFTSGWSLTGGVNNTWERGSVIEYGNDSPARNRISLFSAAKINPSKKWIGVISARQELIQNKAVPFVPSVSLEYNHSDQLNFYTNASRNYRVPTFNDLYWKGAGAVGNPDLKSELSWSNEVGFNFHPGPASREFTLQSAVFSNLVNDWIQWNPTSRGWSPSNIKQVWARGVEVKGAGLLRIRNINHRLTLLYSFTRSTNRSVYDGALSAEVNRFLVFTPQHEGSFSLNSSWQWLSFNLTHTYTGKQYTDGDNSEFFAMKSYQVTNLWLSCTLDLRVRSVVQLEVNNLWDAQYTARPGYPMPGRNFKIALTIQFNKSIKHEN